MCCHNLVKNSTCIPFSVSFLCLVLAGLVVLKPGMSVNVAYPNLLECLVYKNTCTILAIYFSLFPYGLDSYAQKEGCKWGRVVYSSWCNMYRRRAADEAFNPSLHNCTQHSSRFYWSSLGKQTVSDSHHALLTVLIWNFQHDSVQPCLAAASEMAWTQRRVKDNLLL